MKKISIVGCLFAGAYLLIGVFITYNSFRYIEFNQTSGLGILIYTLPWSIFANGKFPDSILKILSILFVFLNTSIIYFIGFWIGSILTRLINLIKRD
jgi:hypothetical protein